MQRRKFIKYSSLASIGASLFPATAIAKVDMSSQTQLVHFSALNTQIRHGNLNLPFAKSLKDELPFDWLLDVHQNIFLKDGFQRNEAEDMYIMSIALQDGDSLEALQISINKEQVSFLWRDQLVLSECVDSLQKIAIEDDVYSFHLVSLNPKQEFTIDLLQNTEYFVQVLEGEVQNEDAALNPNTGLGALSKNDHPLIFKANKKSKFLVISR